MSGTPRGWPGQGLPPGPPALVAAVHGEGVAARAPRAATRWSYALLLVFLLLLYACVPLLFPSFGWLAIAQVTAIAALVAVVAERIAARAAFRLAWPEGYLVVALLGVAAVSTFTALWPRYAFDNTLTIAKCVAAFLLLVNTVETWPRLRQTLGVLVVGGAIPAAGALDYMAHGHYAAGHRIGWLGIFLNSNDLAFAMVVLVAPAVALATTSRSWWRRGACWLAVGLYAAVVYLTYSRGGLIGLGVVLLLCIVRWAPPLAGLPIALLAGAALLYVAPAHWQRQQGWNNLTQDASVEERMATVKAGLAMWADYPLVGVGPGCSVIGWAQYAPPDMLLGEKWLHVHDTPVQVLAETGLLGELAFFGAIAAALLKLRRTIGRARRRRDRSAARLTMAIEISIWGFLVCGLAGGYLTSWFPYILLGLASAACAIPAPRPLRSSPAPLPADWSIETCAASPAS